jgi:nicotinate-nucleotide--dimethylbenzimidazole phosphoribosyltransferase
MTERSQLAGVLRAIRPVKPLYVAQAQGRLDSLTKPIGSLGRLEMVAAQMHSIFSGKVPSPLRRSVYVFAADHGVTAEGVSTYPAEVTKQMVLNFLSGGAAINVLARTHNVALTVIDVGVNADFDDASGLCRKKVRHGSRNMRREPAMTRDELAAALQVGFDVAQAAAAKWRKPCCGR